MRDTIDMAREAGAMFDHMMWIERDLLPVFQRFEALVRADERKAFFTPEEATIALEDTDFTWWNGVTQEMVDKLDAIRARGQG
jgi:hypothetical protein